MHVPEKVYKDLVVNPHLKVERERLKLANAATPAARAAAQEELTLAEQAETVRKQSYDVMRNEVFGADKAQAAAEARWTARGIDPARLAYFRERAAGASTPDQVAVIEASIP